MVCVFFPYSPYLLVFDSFSFGLPFFTWGLVQPLQSYPFEDMYTLQRRVNGCDFSNVIHKRIIIEGFAGKELRINFRQEWRPMKDS